MFPTFFFSLHFCKASINSAVFQMVQNETKEGYYESFPTSGNYFQLPRNYLQKFLISNHIFSFLIFLGILITKKHDLEDLTHSFEKHDFEDLTHSLEEHDYDDLNCSFEKYIFTYAFLVSAEAVVKTVKNRSEKIGMKSVMKEVALERCS